MSTPTTVQDVRFGEAGALATGWPDAEAALNTAELYWITTVRRDGRPHTTPLIGLWQDASFWFCTGPEEQKARNLEHHDAVTVTTGANTWAHGLDVVVEGRAERVLGARRLQQAADGYRTKYGAAWDFTVEGDDAFGSGGSVAHVFRVAPTKVLAFGKKPHSQTGYRF